MHRFLVIQTAFIGDVVLGTAVIEKLHGWYPDAQIDFLVRKGNESLLAGHPYINTLLIWDKSRQKKRNLFRMIRQIRQARYTHVINLHRFATSGILTALSGAPFTAGFDKNPVSLLFTERKRHVISQPYATRVIHETERNQSLIAGITDSTPAKPALYPSTADRQAVAAYKNGPFVCVAPSSVWFTKQFPVDQWARLIEALPQQLKVYLLGGSGDTKLCDEIRQLAAGRQVEILAGRLSFLQSAALMQDAAMNYVNDSGPLHFASAVGAPVTAVFCSTVPAFGFGPLNANARVVEIEERLYCRPCGLHGHKACPEGHFRCALDIKTTQLLWWI
ncbi:MAG: glycosyltransferase family 9 protein [Sphingobacteriales bacterium]|nr:MAG: glycosyltransferase family 9 protein [Sphingobacteriales bacterium]